MANEETRPLLFRVNPSWSGRRNNTNSKTTEASTTPWNTNGAVTRITTLGDRSQSKHFRSRPALAAILISVALERLAFYALIGNLVVFLNLKPFEWKFYHAVCVLYLFFGISYIMCLFGGWISDSCLGHFKTVVISFVIYTCGYTVMPFLATNTENASTVLPRICLQNKSPDLKDTFFKEPCMWPVLIALIIISIGAGILKANICPFGSDQLVYASQQTQLRFFNWFYWSVNMGSIFSIGLLSYIEQQESFLNGFIVGAVALGVAVIITISARPCYIIRAPDGSVLTNIFKIFREAFRNRRQQWQQKQLMSISNGSQDSNQLSEKGIPFLDYAKHQHGGTFHNSLVDDVKKLGMILAVFAVIIPYWLVYFQMQTTFLVQGLHMRLSFSSYSVNGTNTKSAQVAVAWFTLFDAAAVIILLPLFDWIIYPRMAKAGYHFSFAKRMILGMVFAMLAMVAAGILEYFRLKSLHADTEHNCLNSTIQQIIGNTTFIASTMSVLWQIPQYTFIGISEVFATVACLQFAVTVAPKSMKAAVTGLYYLFTGAGSILGFALVSILASVNLWIPSETYGNINCLQPCSSNKSYSSGTSTMDRCHLDFYFYFLAGCEGLGLVLFILLGRFYNLNIDELTFKERTNNGDNK